MKIAVPYDNGLVFGHFGHTEQFKIYEAEDGKVLSTKIVPTQGAGHGALSGFLAGEKVDVLICGGIGMGAQVALAQVGIKIYGGVQGGADAAVLEFLAGSLVYDPDAKCDHHHHEDGHGCGDNCTCH